MSAPSTMFVTPITEGVVTFAIVTPGYESKLDVPVGKADDLDEFCNWLRMQLDHLARWKPGTTTHIRETREASEPRAR